MFCGAITLFPACHSLVDPKDETIDPHAPITDCHTLFGALPSALVLDEFSIHTSVPIITAVGGDCDLTCIAEAWPRLRALLPRAELGHIVCPPAPSVVNAPAISTILAMKSRFRALDIRPFDSVRTTTIAPSLLIDCLWVTLSHHRYRDQI